MQPDGWTNEDEVEYQAYLSELKARIDAAGSSSDIGILVAAYDMLNDPDTGRAYYLKAKRNGWLA